MGMVWVMTRATDGDVASLRADPATIYDFINAEEAEDSGRLIDLDKEWHAVHFLLTGSAGRVDGPLGIILGNFEEIGPDHGYGAAWLVPSEKLSSCNEALARYTDVEWAARYDMSAALTEDVYLADALQEEGEDCRGYLQAGVARLRAFVAEAAAAGDNAFALIT